MFGLLYLVVAVLSRPLGFSPMPLHMVGFTLSIGVMADWPTFPQLYGNNRIEQGKSLVAPRLDQIYYLVSNSTCQMEWLIDEARNHNEK